jgi:hypothetical protein
MPAERSGWSVGLVDAYGAQADCESRASDGGGCGRMVGVDGGGTRGGVNYCDAHDVQWLQRNFTLKHSEGHAQYDCYGGKHSHRADQRGSSRLCGDCSQSSSLFSCISVRSLGMRDRLTAARTVDRWPHSAGAESRPADYQ